MTRNKGLCNAGILVTDAERALYRRALKYAHRDDPDADRIDEFDDSALFQSAMMYVLKNSDCVDETKLKVIGDYDYNEDEWVLPDGR